MKETGVEVTEEVEKEYIEYTGGYPYWMDILSSFYLDGNNSSIKQVYEEHELEFFKLFDGLMDLLKDQDQIVLQFKDKNPNGSMEAITSVCDESGLVCAMMPHPERACEEILGSSDGLNFFKGFL